MLKKVPGRTKRIEAARARVMDALKLKEASFKKIKPKPPRYDDVYYRGVAWLDTLEGFIGMGNRQYSYLGAYVKIHMASRVVNTPVRRCSKNEVHTGVGDLTKYCPDCGCAIQTYHFERTAYPTLHDLLEELNMVDVIWEIGSCGDVTIAGGNNREKSEGTRYDPTMSSFVSKDSSCSVYSIDGFEDPLCMIERFKTNYDEILQALREHPSVVSVEVLFGLVTYYM